MLKLQASEPTPTPPAPPTPPTPAQTQNPGDPFVLLWEWRAQLAVARNQIFGKADAFRKIQSAKVQKLDAGQNNLAVIGDIETPNCLAGCANHCFSQVGPLHL